MTSRDRRLRSQARPSRGRRATLRSTHDDTAEWMVGDGEAARPSRAPRRRLIPIRFYLLAILALALVAVVLGVSSVWTRVGAFNDRVSTAPALSTALFGELNGDEPVNVVIFGYNDESRSGAYLTDSINVISVDPVSDTTTVIPIPRDIWVEGVGVFTGKINEAFRVGFYADGIVNAGELATESVAAVTGLEIHGWIALEFEGFRQMVDAIGGVTLENPVAFGYTWSEPQFRAGTFPHHFPAGTLELNGQEALDYARARYASVPAEASDFARSIRQQRVLSAIKSNVGGGIGAIGPGLKMMDAVGDRLNTNLSVIDLYLLSDRIDPDRRIALDDGHGLVATSNSIGQYILLPAGMAGTGDYSPLHRHIQQELAKPIPTPSPGPSPA